MKKQLLVLGLAAGLVASPILSQETLGAADVHEKIKWSQKVGTPEFVAGKLTKPSSKNAEEVVFGYINENRTKFKVSGEAKTSFIVKEQKKDELGYTYLRLQQVYKGTPVYGAVMTAHVDGEGVLTAVSGAVQPDLDQKGALKAGGKLKKQEATTVAEQDLIESLGSTPEYEYAPKSELVIFVDGEEAHYAYQVNLNFLSPEPGNWNYFVDAVTGKVLNKINEIHTAKGKPGKPGGNNGTDEVGTGIGVLGGQKSLNTYLSSSTYYLQDNTRGGGIFTYDANQRTRLPGSLWADDDNVLNASYDGAAVDAHHYAGVTYDYYMNVFNRDSYDGKGAPLESTVHYSRSYNNAFWNGRQMVYGDGDGSTFIPLSGSLDVVAHELTHAVTDTTADLIYSYESGAINEAMSDIFGTLVEFEANNNPDWEMGEDVYTPGVRNDALRSLSDPTKYNDPDHYSVRYTGSGDNGGVHINSGIINKAAYLLSEGGSHYGVTVRGIGQDKLGDIFYRSLTQYLTPSSSFSHLRATAVQSATDLYGAGSAEVTSVNQAFDAVGIE
ncbi:M4 family metallopeptidase [Bacillus spongiae]|uniref:Neutral metalloproteinase n=1 Tax=Bacillus spongiae TaxID=2683610 RepID=A0ABU8HDZ8_9BACI